MTLKQIFKAVDSRDAEIFADYFSDDGVFRFANQPVVTGKQDIKKFVSGFFVSVAAIEHQIEEQWPIDNGQACHGQVTYTRHDQSTLSVPFALVVKTGATGISEYLIFVDPSMLYAD